MSIFVRKDLAHFLFQWPDELTLVISAVPASFVFTDFALSQFDPLIPFTKCVCVCVRARARVRVCGCLGVCVG